MEQNPKKMFVSYSDIVNHCKKLAETIKGDSIKYDCIISIGRGGMVPSRLISELLDIRDVQIFNIKAYTEDKKLGKVSTGSFDYKKLEGKNVLIVDDVYTTGTTIDTVTKLIFDNVEIICLTTVTVFENIQQLNNNRQPDIYSTVYNADSDWIVFPWEDEALCLPFQ